MPLKVFNVLKSRIYCKTRRLFVCLGPFLGCVWVLLLLLALLLWRQCLHKKQQIHPSCCFKSRVLVSKSDPKSLSKPSGCVYTLVVVFKNKKLPVSGELARMASCGLGNMSLDCRLENDSFGHAVLSAQNCSRVARSTTRKCSRSFNTM